MSLYYSSNKDSKLIGAFRVVLSHYLFGSQIRRFEQKDHSQALLVSSGSDTFQSIGPPPNVTRGSQGNADDEWIKALQQSFPKPSKK